MSFYYQKIYEHIINNIFPEERALIKEMMCVEKKNGFAWKKKQDIDSKYYFYCIVIHYYMW